MTNDLVSVIDVAERLGVHKQSVFKVLKRLGISHQKLRDVSRKNQFTSFITNADAERVSAEISSDSGLGSGEGQDDSDLFSSNDIGFFYLIQLEPEHDPGRFKVGFATNMKERLRKHRCSAPYSTVLKTWPCRRTWEKAAIDCVADPFEQIHTEVFRSNVIDEAVRRGSAFFEIAASNN